MLLWGPHLGDPRPCQNFSMKLILQKLEGENCIILTSNAFDWSTRVTDGQTELRWHIRAIAYILLRVKRTDKCRLVHASFVLRSLPTNTTTMLTVMHVTLFITQFCILPVCNCDRDQTFATEIMTKIKPSRLVTISVYFWILNDVLAENGKSWHDENHLCVIWI